MILSRTATHALRAALVVQAAGGERRTVDAIAGELDVPRNYLSKILHALAQEGLLESTRGPGGGFTLARPPETITLAEVVVPFDDVLSRPGCLLGRGECSDDDPCRVHGRWRAISTELRAFLTGTTLADLPADGPVEPDLR